MSFTRDYDTNVPIDHTLNNLWPTKIRNVVTDIGERLSAIVSGFTSGETVKGILKLPFIAVAKPSNITDQILMYAKDVSGKTELFIQDEDADEMQVTSDGKLNSLALKSSTVANIANIMELIYPIGYVITLGVSTNPATLLGVGTWTAIAGKVIVGIDGTQTEFDVLNETGGEKTHVLTQAELPSYNLSLDVGAGDGSNAAPRRSDGNTAGDNAEIPSGGSGTAHNNLQPYIVKYCWQRVS